MIIYICVIIQFYAIQIHPCILKSCRNDFILFYDPGYVVAGDYHCF
jgi:hypothetical protein